MDFSLGAGGTLPTQALMTFPPTFTAQVLQSPFLHLYGTFKPNLLQAALILDPSAASNLFPLATSGVLLYSLEMEVRALKALKVVVKDWVRVSVKFA